MNTRSKSPQLHLAPSLPRHTFHLLSPLAMAFAVGRKSWLCLNDLRRRRVLFKTVMLFEGVLCTENEPVSLCCPRSSRQYNNLACNHRFLSRHLLQIYLYLYVSFSVPRICICNQAGFVGRESERDSFFFIKTKDCTKYHELLIIDYRLQFNG